MSGMPNRISGAGAWVSQWPSIAATFCGWWSSAQRPCMSPNTAWAGATAAAIHIAMENMTRARSLPRSRSRWKAPTAPTIIAVVRKAPVTVCR